MLTETVPLMVINNTTEQPVESSVAPPAVSRGRIPWGRVIAVAGMVVLLYWTIVGDLLGDWWTIPAYSHGIVVLPLSIWLVFQTRQSILSIAPRPDSRGLAITAFACLMYVTGQLGAELFLQRISLPVLLVGLLVTFWGAQRAARLSLPLLLFTTSIPIPAIVYNRAAADLQLLASSIATSVAHAFGVSAYRDGNIISLANITLGVAEACSGLNSLSALMVSSVLVGFLQFERAWPRWVLFLLSAPLAVLVNVVRVAGTAILADRNPAFALGLIHLFSGWLVFSAGLALLYLCAKALQLVPQSRR